MKLIKAAFIKTLPIMAGYIPLGIGFGVLLESQGYNAVWAFFMALTMFAGSMQYVAVSLLASGASIITAFITTLMVNARHLFYGVSLIDMYKGAGKYKPYMIFGLTDETYSLICTGDIPEGVHPHKFRFTVTMLNQCYWITGCVLGALLGAALNFDSKGIEFVMTALFITVFVDQWKSTRNHLPALTGIIATVAAILIFGRDNFLIPAMCAISLAMWLGRKHLEHGHDQEEQEAAA